MNFIIREKETEEDMEIFITQEIISAIENNYTTAKSDEEMREELLAFRRRTKNPWLILLNYER